MHSADSRALPPPILPAAPAEFERVEVVRSRLDIGFAIVVIATHLAVAAGTLVVLPEIIAGGYPLAIAPTLWFGFFGWLTRQDLRAKGGWRRWLEVRGGALAPRHFMRVEKPTGEPPWVSFGYQLFGRTVRYLRVRLPGVLGVSWNEGQASHMRGKDMNDWTVVVWYDPRQAEPPPTCDRRPSSFEGLCFGSALARARTEPCGLAVVRLLQQSGLVLEASQAGCKHAQPGAKIPPWDQAQLAEFLAQISKAK